MTEIVVSAGVLAAAGLVGWMFAVTRKLSAVETKIDNLAKPQGLCLVHAREIEELKRRVEAVE